MAKGDAWPLWLLDFPHDHSTSYDFLTDVTLQINMCISWASTWNFITTSMAHSSDVAKTTHYTTWHDIADMYWMTMFSMSSCYDVEWWMWFQCVVSSPLHDKVLKGIRWFWYFLDDSMHVSLLLVVWCALFMQLWVVHPACAPYSSHSLSCHVLSMHMFLQFTRDEMKSNPKIS